MMRIPSPFLSPSEQLAFEAPQVLSPPPLCFIKMSSVPTGLKAFTATDEISKRLPIPLTPPQASNRFFLGGWWQRPAGTKPPAQEGPIL